MSFSPNAPIAIIGAGISGLTLARDLLRRGIASTIYEKSAAPPPLSLPPLLPPLPLLNNPTITTTTTHKPRHNYGITLSAPSCTSLARILSLSTSTFRTQVCVSNDDNNGNHHNDHLSDGDNPSHSCPQRPSGHQPLRVHRGRLESLLAAGLDIKWAHDLASIDLHPLPPRTSTSGPHKDRDTTANSPLAKLRFANGHETTASLVVGADGVHSSLRTLLVPRLKPRVLPYVVFRGQRRVDAAEFRRVWAPVMRKGKGREDEVELRRGTWMLYVGVDDGRALSAVDGAENESSSDSVLVSWFYSRRAASQDVLYRPDRAVHEAKTVPEDFYAEISGIRGSFKAEGVDDEQETFLKHVFDEEKMRTQDRIQNFLMRRLAAVSSSKDQDSNDFIALARSGGGVVFLGDAAHATPIVGSEGADYAIHDALDLAGVLGEDYGSDPGAFTEEKTRAKSVEPVVTQDHHWWFRIAILKFYEAKLSATVPGASSEWEALGKDAEHLLATMHDT